MTSPTLDLARALIRRPSVTPEDAGCQALIAERLAPLDFAAETLRFGEVTNLWLRRGEAAPLLVFLGHTDVVPPGPEARWRHPPFEPALEDGLLYGRGAADMKGSVAAFVTACERVFGAAEGVSGSVALLLTSDEEGPARDGTRRVAETLAARGEGIDWCLVGEPSSEARFGDVIKVGRRGSLNGWLTVRGRQGHVAYPHLADNPVHRLAPLLAELVAMEWDRGTDEFPPTTFQISNLEAGTGAGNVIPGEARVAFNLRFSPASTAAGLEARIAAMVAAHGLDAELAWQRSAEPFASEPGPLRAALIDAVTAETGEPPRPSTAGGTSDGRFIAPLGAEVVELGPRNATIHQVDEHVAAADLDALSHVYEAVIRRLLAP
ncbi:succinyl-diaminopimelate desuccinylase [Sediminicurvatus halobius]|uniref:Succinyl-diaminopimelate desuccinylase n=1 Tax=Sediminicurvatus halobius TaxID=2182432 RepID=A0A2U2N4K4_9GAMM|nr:succinyl-diaminopimelate desuccinylase [Spiribacter halobius]PWG63899.1 succinyl-diaminopimelate desuccinylase [Spiribacter halobius]UEX76311.1 succinyl-diaminopimelate desuccinylase [Spiribacter halobius]